MLLRMLRGETQLGSRFVKMQDLQSLGFEAFNREQGPQL